MRSRGKRNTTRKRKIRKMSSGYFGIRNCFRIGSRAILKANAHRKKSYKLSLRNFKKQRIFLLNSALSGFNIKYNNFMY